MPEAKVAAVELEQDDAAGMTEVARPDMPMLAEMAAMKPLAVARDVRRRADVGWGMAEARAAVTGLGRQRRHSRRDQHGCEHYDLAHRLAPS